MDTVKMCDDDVENKILTKGTNKMSAEQWKHETQLVLQQS